MRRIGWFLFILGMTLGFIFGLYYAWEISPFIPQDAKPSDLQPDSQIEYQTLIALAYANTGNISRAIRRLETLPESNSAESLSALAQRHLADGRPEEYVLAVAQLAAALENPTQRAPILQETSGIATPTSPPTQTPTNVPLPTRTSTPIPAYQLHSQEKVCDPLLGIPLLQVLVFDVTGEPVPGVEVVVSWESGDNRFFTGLKPDVSPGYGDFIMSVDIPYTIRIGDSGQSITGLEVEDCVTDGQVYPSSWLLTFVEP
jgi:hypothetical protein